MIFNRAVAVALAAVAGILVAPNAYASATPLALGCPTPPITVPGNYIVTTPAHTRCSAATIVVIDVSNVTLDLNGRTVEGNAVTGQVCISVPNTTINDVVRNGTVHFCE